MESAHIIDAETNLVGVCNTPEGVDRSTTPGVLFINAGFLHRVGPNRMNTLLARQLATRGFASLRMDLSGLGDSLGRSSSSDDYQIVADDLDSAMRFMQEQCGKREFVLVGLCSGAHDTARKALEDERVVGLVNIDGVGYRTRRFYLNHVFMHLLRRVAQPQRWRRLLDRYRARSRQRAAGEVEPMSILSTGNAYTDWSREQAGRNLEQLAARGVKMQFIYTGGVSGFYNYRSQFEDIFKEQDFRGKASSAWFPATDHLCMLQHHRDEVHRCIVDWCSASFG